MSDQIKKILDIVEQEPVYWYSRTEDIERMGTFPTQLEAWESVIGDNGTPLKGATVWCESKLCNRGWERRKESKKKFEDKILAGKIPFSDLKINSNRIRDVKKYGDEILAKIFTSIYEDSDVKSVYISNFDYIQMLDTWSFQDNNLIRLNLLGEKYIKNKTFASIQAGEKIVLINVLDSMPQGYITFIKNVGEGYKYKASVEMKSLRDIKIPNSDNLSEGEILIKKINQVFDTNPYKNKIIKITVSQSNYNKIAEFLMLERGGHVMHKTLISCLVEKDSEVNDQSLEIHVSLEK